ncbi:hypothetical protein [Sulfurimonas sp.]|jgi:hypothetical protein|uniref:hypothetical protein n=1 Tax=Sulfurimonas sp. TaxID=2022749 RepID=UPI0025D1CC2F|nr:hypothetical protein [Sulfurimonas sp.]MBT5935519.1 hypothetical protein [Sulfurimonas sp.]
MDLDKKIERQNNKNIELRDFVKNANKVYKSFFKTEYNYSNNEALEELGLDEELMDQLLEDYISQIIKAIVQFEHMIYKLQNAKDAKKELDYTELRDLAHKNLGVARNLRIKDAVILLDDLMNKDELEYLFLCIEVLQASAVRINPKCAFNTIKLIEVKSSF